MSRVRVTAEGLNELHALLEGAERDVLPEARKVVAKGCLNIKRDAQRKVAGIAHAPHYPRSITYETWLLADSALGEVGPDKDKPQGALGNVFEYGTVNNPPYAHLGPALDYEGPEFEKYLGSLGGDLLQ